MITFTSNELYSLVAGMLWPLVRILGLIAAAPLYGNRSVPARAKVMLAVMLTLVIAPAIPKVSPLDPMSLPGLLIVAQQLLIGLAMGFSVRIVFSAVEMAGEIIGLTMGLGFATFFDPQSSARTSAISQFLALIATTTFLSVNGHLVLLSVLAESFTTLPIAAEPIAGFGLKQLADWGSKIFSSGLHLSLPILTALLLVNIALGILTRAAPQLNLFGIGFPITLAAGYLMIMFVVPYLSNPLQFLFNEGIEKARQLPRTMQEREPRELPVIKPLVLPSPQPPTTPAR
ncbi:MAG: flagellar biosynthetic protein FliR [Burkholderiales bacterium]|nr:flagellar biosynthetic protein FliR [Burkholderiales bacterium]